MDSVTDKGYANIGITNNGNTAMHEDGCVVWIEQARLARANPGYEREVMYEAPQDDVTPRRAGTVYHGPGENILECWWCGRNFTSHYPLSRWCSGRCANDAYIKRRRERRAAAREKVCEICGEPFTATRADAKTCSARCKQRAYRQRHMQPTRKD